MSQEPQSNLRIGKKAFLTAFFIILSFMIISGILTKIVPAGLYDRITVNGLEKIVDGSFAYHARPDYPVWRWFTAPVEVLFSKDNIGLITVIALLVFLGGAFTILEKGNILKTILYLIVNKFQYKKYLLMAIIIFFFMFFGSALGIFEAMVPLVIFIVPLAHILGWDSLVGLGMSLLAIAFGFGAGVTNPMNVGIPQQVAELPLFSGAWLRIIYFCFVYGAVLFFVRRYAKKIEADPTASLVYNEDLPLKKNYSHDVVFSDMSSERDPRMSRAIVWFITIICLALVFVVISSRIDSIRLLAFPMMGVLFLIGGVGAGLLAGMGIKGVAKTFWQGTAMMLPAILLVLMAMSVKHIILTGGIMDTILYLASSYIKHTTPYVAAFFIFLLTLCMKFFIGSASAKAFLMMPILTPLADLVGITRQTAVMAFDMGDAFGNMAYPTSALLLIALGLTVVGYTKWIKWTYKLHLFMLILGAGFIAFAVWIKYGPF